MTKKDFELIAESLRFTAQYTASNSPQKVEGVLLAAKALAVDLKRTNPRFSPERFMEWVTKC